MPDPPTLEQLAEAVDEHLRVTDAINATLQTNRRQGQTTFLLNMLIRMQSGILVVDNQPTKAALVLGQNDDLRAFLNRNIVTVHEVVSGALRGRREPLFWDNSAVREFLPGVIKSIRLRQTAESPLQEEPPDGWTWYDALDQHEGPDD